MPLDQQIKSVFAQNPSDSSQVLYVLLVDPTSKTTTIEMLSKAANEILLTKQISRLLILDTPLPFSKEPAGFDSLQLSNYLVNDPRIELMTYDSNGFLRYMQENYYKYGLRHPENPCVYTQRIKCSRPERFFWCQAGKIGDKAHYFMADDIIQKHFLSSVP
ncbi:hypothetical protein J3B02_004832 [Coemansia erecta]|nr:hypothetical protein J3B02_004832 [Coemansia erecta]